MIFSTQFKTLFEVSKRVLEVENFHFCQKRKFREFISSKRALCVLFLIVENKTNCGFLNFNIKFREAKFKRALRVHFLTHFPKNFCHFLTPKVKSGLDRINPSIESSDFLFWHQKNFELDF